MDYLAVGVGVAGAIAGVPTAAVAYAAPARGSLRLPQRWWYGAPAHPATVFSVSLVAGTATAVVAARLPMSPAAPAHWIFAMLGVGLAIIDIRLHRLPHVMTGTLWAVSAAGLVAESMISGHVQTLARGAAAGAAVVVSALLIALVLPGQLGLGDVSLSGVIALSLGALSLETAAFGLIAGATLQAFIALASKFRNRSLFNRSHMPFGPALLIGWFFALTIFSS